LGGGQVLFPGPQVPQAQQQQQRQLDDQAQHGEQQQGSDG
jgi:hypothetical protein